MEPTEIVNSQEAEAIADKLEWLARDIRGKASTGELTPQVVTREMAQILDILDGALDRVEESAGPQSGKWPSALDGLEPLGMDTSAALGAPTFTERLAKAANDEIDDRLALQAERAAQEIERRANPRWSDWRRLIGR